tara:strand:- start:5 stop:478 length:474 start_codon:yes stop_codon:yes gene_type:complete
MLQSFNKEKELKGGKIILRIYKKNNKPVIKKKTVEEEEIVKEEEPVKEEEVVQEPIVKEEEKINVNLLKNFITKTTKEEDKNITYGKPTIGEIFDNSSKYDKLSNNTKIVLSRATGDSLQKRYDKLLQKIDDTEDEKLISFYQLEMEYIQKLNPEVN